MKAMTRYLAGLVALGFCTAGLFPGVAYSQPVGGVALIAGSNGKMFLLNLTAGTATPLSFTPSEGDNLIMSPDRQRLVAYGQNGIAVYQISGTNIQKVAQVSQAPTANLFWTEDSKTLVFLQETKQGNNVAATQISMWDRDTGLTKRLL